MKTASKQARWTVMVFLNAKNSLEEFSFPNFQQMANVGSSPDLNIIVEFGRPKKHYVHGKFGDWSKTLRFRVEKGMTPTVGNAVEDCGQVNMGAKEALADFVQWSMASYPADHYALIIWDHGQGWRMPTEEEAAASGDRFASVRHVAPKGGFKHPHIATFRSVSLDDDTKDKLYNREIQDGLAELLGGRKLDLIGFDACLMGMIETAYALRGVSRVLVGSEEVEPGDGWNYEKWLAPLAANPGSFDGLALGKQAVEAYQALYGKDSDATMSAVDLSQMDTLRAAVDEVAATALLDLDDQLPALKKARGQCSKYSPDIPDLSSIDLKRFMDRLALASSGGSAVLRARAAAASSAVKSSVLETYRGSLRGGKFGSWGLGIYFPKSLADFNADPDSAGYLPSNTSFPVEFVQTGRWAALLQAYFARVAS